MLRSKKYSHSKPPLNTMMKLTQITFLKLDLKDTDMIRKSLAKNHTDMIRKTVRIIFTETGTNILRKTADAGTSGRKMIEFHKTIEIAIENE